MEKIGELKAWTVKKNENMKNGERFIRQNNERHIF